ncbi:MAG: hypothetical protein ACOC3V_01195 [bacterium]
MKKIFIICPVTTATIKERNDLIKYVNELESMDYIVHYPYRDTPQNEIDLNINRINTKKIKTSDEVHIYYKPKSKGIHFDLGNLFSLKESHKNWILSLILRTFGIKNPKVLLINKPNNNNNSYSNMLEQWINE